MSLPYHSSLTRKSGEYLSRMRWANWCVCEWQMGFRIAANIHRVSASWGTIHPLLTHTVLQCFGGFWIQKDHPPRAPHSLLARCRLLDARRGSDLENQIQIWSRWGGTSGVQHKSGRLSWREAAASSLLWGVISHICTMLLVVAMAQSCVFASMWKEGQRQSAGL